MKRSAKAALIGLIGISAFLLPGGDCEIDISGFGRGGFWYPYDYVIYDPYYYDPFCCWW
jgi:hypothetical protein